MYENELKDYLKEQGASLVGFGDLRNLENTRDNMVYGVAIAIKLDPYIIKKISEGPTNEYYEEYRKANEKLDAIASKCEMYIENLGFKATAQTSTYVTSNDNLATNIPHKTIATRSGLGWIGKCALLVTPEYGSAVRISSILTDMPLGSNTAIDNSKCGNCSKCVDSCPARAISGHLWNIETNREELVDVFKCRETARWLSKKKIGLEISLCGKCIEVCPFTRKYLNSTF